MYRGGRKLKNPKKLNRKHKIFIEGKGMDPANYLVVKNMPTKYVFYNIITKELIEFER